MKRLVIYTILSCHLFLASCSKDEHLSSSEAGMPWKASPDLQRSYAGNDQLIELPAREVRLSGGVVDFYSSHLTKFTWRKISGPDGVVIQNPDSASTLLTNISPGEYEFELAAVHPDLKIQSDTVSIVAGRLENNAEEILLKKQKWEVPCFTATISITDLYARNPRLVPGRFFKLFIKREDHTEWQAVVPYSAESSKYFFLFHKNQRRVEILYFGEDYADAPDVKVVF